MLTFCESVTVKTFWGWSSQLSTSYQRSLPVINDRDPGGLPPRAIIYYSFHHFVKRKFGDSPPNPLKNADL
jgi:hypothetical protein